MKFFTIYIQILCFTALALMTSCGNSLKPLGTGNKTGNRHPEETTLMNQNAQNKNITDLSKNNAMRWHYSKNAAETRGVALVVHGLNLRPDKMEAIISRLTDTGIDALNLSLQGHGENYFHDGESDSAVARLQSFKEVSYNLWMEETCYAYSVAKLRSDQQKVPLFLVGFSLGGLMGADLLATEPEVHFDKMVLFAPALKMHLRNYIIRVVSAFPDLSIPSLMLGSYQSNEKTPMAGYNALFESLKHFEENASPKLNIPTLVFIDKKDELVSYSRLKNMVEKEKLDQWQFYIVQKENTKESTKIYHLIIDAPSTGEHVWKDMMDTMAAHLLEH
jgi:alpha-beta hydrolase superfamily lysophospholipase